jgi:hypothetical protein
MVTLSFIIHHSVHYQKHQIFQKTVQCTVYVLANTI